MTETKPSTKMRCRMCGSFFCNCEEQERERQRDENKKEDESLGAFNNVVRQSNNLIDDMNAKWKAVQSGEVPPESMRYYCKLMREEIEHAARCLQVLERRIEKLTK